MLTENNGVTAPKGFRAAGVACGLKPNGALDLALLASDSDCACAGVFTTNRVQAAPVVYDKQVLATNPDSIRAVVANSRCANACTGDAGLEDARAMAEAAAQAIGRRADQVLVLSTGVIGTRLEMAKIRAGIADAAPRLSIEGGADAARAIMTTDTRPKVYALRFTHYAIAGMCKGAGMIHPNMATMLAVITTDVRIAPNLLNQALHAAVAKSFNRVSVDGDMSTNDTLLVLANGASGFEIGDLEIRDFTNALTQVAIELAKQIARDGEGATKFVEINVTGAASEHDAARVAKAIANSPLVKTAIYGADANWGRVVCAAGYSGVEVEPNKMALWFGDVNVFARGTPTNFDEADSTRAISGADVTIRLDLGMGRANATVWTCDLSHDYVTINGKYRT
ncbi:MAG: bifunctional glutamate N-acetyltransferase/amino-acid acetyltransferase ArgJ [Chloroflexi bacterium]|nr:bifunctional glutamate N-acetyltransferase/amino-acid acetyltransferase ArgJ [Chloroflexota bacterium]